jgi:hypothetical protein
MRYTIFKIDKATYKRFQELPAGADSDGRALLTNNPKYVDSLKSYTRDQMIDFLLMTYVQGGIDISYDSSVAELVPDVVKKLQRAKTRKEDEKKKSRGDAADSLDKKIKLIEAALASLPAK